MHNELKSLTRDLVARAVDGDARALDTIVRTLEGPLYNLALRMLGGHADAQDITQECLLRVVTRLASYRAEAAFSTWVWRVALNCILDARKGRARRVRLGAEQFEQSLQQGLDLQAPQRAEDRVYLHQIKSGCSRAMLQCLDGVARATYVLVELLGLTAPAAAQVLEVSAETVRKRVSRAKAKLSEAMAPLCGVLNPAAACRCHRRLAHVRAAGWIDARDQVSAGPDARNLDELGEWLEQMLALDRITAFFGSEPAARLAPERVAKIRSLLRLGPATTTSHKVNKDHGKA